MSNKLYKKEYAKQFYENRYVNGYMDEWPNSKKQRVFEIIRMLHLPDSGNALDFGCGNGVFTDVLRQALPKWKIYGCDISQNAIDNAKQRFQFCSFFVSGDEPPLGIKFDFLFSHHVLEHVFDIRKTINEINALLKPKSYVLHIFPCGNEGSFEYKVCSMRADGINNKMENRFFFEDEGHVRRLTTEQANTLMNEHGFSLEKDFYSNQFYGAIQWISQSFPKFIIELTNPKKAIDKKAHQSLYILRFLFMLLCFLQLPANIFNRLKLVRDKSLKHYCLWIIDFIPFLISYPVYVAVNYKAKKEWDNSKQLKHGSEMYLFYSQQ